MDTIKLAHIKTARVSSIQSKGILLTGGEAYDWLKKRRNLKGWTYNYNEYCPLFHSFKQIITCKGKRHPKVKFADNVHLKCYMDLKVMIVGSFNLVYPTIEDLCVLIEQPGLVSFMRLQFRTHWNSL